MTVARDGLMNNDKSLRKHVVELLEGGHAYAPFDKVIADFSPKLRGEKPSGLPHSAWMLLEHMRTAQWDILDFSRNSKYKNLLWPEHYWPKDLAPPSAAAWNTSIQSFRDDLEAMKKLVSNPETDLFAKIPWGDGQTI